MKRPHDIEQARREHDQHTAQATAKHPRNSPAWYAEMAILGLGDTARLGLMDCYASFGDHDHLCDFWAGLDWDRPGRDQAVRLILSDPRFLDICEAILNGHGFDLRAELQPALDAPDANTN